MRFQFGRAVEKVLPILAALVVAWPAAIAQTHCSARNSARLDAGSHEVAPSPIRTPIRILREIRDPHSGTHWLVTRNAQDPAGPGFMTVASEILETIPDSVSGKRAPSVVIHAGDRLVVEEHTAVAQGYLDAVALNAAEVGGTLDIRLKIGSKVRRAVAIAPGRAALAQLREARP